MEEKTIATNKEYPQFSENVKESRSSEATYGISAFEVSPAVHNRPFEIKEIKKTDRGIRIKLSVKARKSVLSYTHETSLHLYKPDEATIAEEYINVELWSDEIFRISFSKEEEITDYYAKIPKEYRMLIAEPLKVNSCLENTAETINIKTEKIEIKIDKSNLKISASYLGGNEFFAEKKTDFKAADIHDLSISELAGKYACFEAVELDMDEVIYGLGERFDCFTRNGRTVDFHNKDAVGTTSQRSYVNVPFYMSTKGYGLFLNSSAKTNWEVGTKDLGAVEFSVLEPQIDYFVIAGRNPKEILKGYCFLTGFSKMPPLWSFGLWMSRNSYTSWEVVDAIAKEVRENDVPCDVLHLDTAWFTEDWNCDLKFSKERFPEPQKHIEKLKDEGFNVTLWQYNFIPPKDNNDNYKEAKEHGYLAKNEEGGVYHLPEECKGSWIDDTIIDFSNPDARKWYGEKISGLMELGASAMKTDFGEGIPEEAQYDSIDGDHFHNLYSLVYNGTVFDACKKVTGENMVWGRSGTAGIQRFPIRWGGDSQCSFDALAGTLRGALSIGMSGVPFFSHDIGGFIGVPDDELYIRWAQLGLFSSHSRCHGVGDDAHREPWYFSKEALEIFRFYDKLRYSLMPYIYEEAEKCTRTGLPMMRALFLEYPEDRNVRFIDDEYLFGDSILIAPVLKPLSKGNTRSIYLPKGTWYDYFTKEKIESEGMWIEREVDLKTMPMYVKAGTVLKYAKVNDNLKNGIDEIEKTEVWDM